MVTRNQPRARRLANEHLMPRERPGRHTACLYRQLAELRGIQLLHVKLYQRCRPNSSSATLTADVIEDLLEWHARLAGSPAVPRPVELLEPAFVLRPRPLRYRWARTELPGEVFEQDLLSGWGSLSTAAWIAERVLMRGKVARPVQRRRASRQVDKVARE